MSLPAPPVKGQRIEHPDWNGRRRKGVVVEVVNRWHVDVIFDFYPRRSRVAIASLQVPDEDVA